MKFDVYCDIFPLLCHARDSRAKEVMYGMHIHVCTYWYVNYAKCLSEAYWEFRYWPVNHLIVLIWSAIFICHVDGCVPYTR